MRKFYYLLFTLLCGLAGTTDSSAGIKVNFHVDNASHVQISCYGTPYTIKDGDNILDITLAEGQESQGIQIKATNGYFLKSVTSPSGVAQSISGLTTSYVYVTKADDNGTYTIKTATEDEMRTGSFTVNVDDASIVSMVRQGTYSTVSLKDGTQTVKYVPGTESVIQIQHTTYGKTLYDVKHNGNDVEQSAGTYYVTLLDNAENTIDITANYPAGVTYPVSFTLKDNAEECITSVTVDGKEQTGFANSTIDVPAGSTLVVTGNISDFKVYSFRVNNIEQSFYGTYTCEITGHTDFAIHAHKYGKLNYVVNIDNPENITMYHGYTYQNRIVELKKGRNTLQIPEQDNHLVFKANSGCNVTYAHNGKEKLNADFNNEYNVDVTEGLELNIETSAIERNKKIAFYVDDITAAVYQFNLNRGDRSSVNVVSGYNEIKFYDGDVPFLLGFYGAPYNNVYLNNTKAYPTYANGTSYEFYEISDGDVLKAFIAKDPKSYNVKFTLDGVKAEDVTIIRDRVAKVTSPSAGLTCFEGTEISVSTANVSVTANGKTVAANSEGKAVITVNSDTAITLKGSSTGIHDINAETTGTRAFNPQGIEVDAKTAKGIVIINGKKHIAR